MRPSALLSLSVLLACRADPQKDTGADDGTTAADLDADGTPSDADCDDLDPAAFPGAPEVCDGVDNDCDGSVDEDVTTAAYADVDGDGAGDAAAPQEVCGVPDGYTTDDSDCDDRDADSYPGAPERCDGADNDCDGVVDNDVLTAWYADADGDGYGDPDTFYAACDPPPGYLPSADDCDDLDAAAFPGGTEVCDEADNDCDGTIDEDVTTTWYRDVDGDNFGLADETTEACDQPTGYAPTPGDCDDAEVRSSPIGVEVCDGADNDCDGTVDEDDAVDAASWYADADGDGYADGGVVAVACAAPAGYRAVLPGDPLDCDDTRASVSPGASESCNSTDDDCDGDVDEDAADAIAFYADSDGDGYGSRVTVSDCTPPSGFVAAGGDCDDGDIVSYPGAAEVCDAADNDCDGTVDEDVPDAAAPRWYADADGDGYGDPDQDTHACTVPSGYTDDSSDCDDDDADIWPGAAEVCDGLDGDCDGTVDEGTLGTGYACPAESCAEIIADQPSAADGRYYLDWDGDGYPGVYTCDMTSDGGGWTQVVAWSAEDDGDDWTDLTSALTTVYDNMTRKLTGSGYIYWADWDSTADVLAYKRTVTMPNSGEIRLDLHYTGYSMDNSAAFFYAETTSGDEDILCKEDDDGGYNTTEYSYWPYTCAASADGTWTWDGVWQEAFSDEITAFHMRSFHYDGSGGDYSYLYRLNVYIR